MDTDTITPAEPARRPSSGGSPAEGLEAQFVVFELDQQRYAMPLHQVITGVRMVAFVRIPEAPAGVLGAIDFHGHTIPILDLRPRFGQPSREPRVEDRLLVVQAADRRAAILVDEVCDVVGVEPRAVEPPPSPLHQVRPLAAVIHQDQNLVLVLDLDRLLPELETFADSKSPQATVGTESAVGPSERDNDRQDAGRPG